MTTPVIAGYPVAVQFRMHWGEMDTMGHANNARFFTWFESSRLEYFERLKLTFDPVLRIGPILAHTACDYLQPVVFPADLISAARVSKVGKTSMTLEHALARADAPDNIVAKGTAIIVLVSYVTGEKIEIPADVRAQIAVMEGRS